LALATLGILVAPFQGHAATAENPPQAMGSCTHRPGVVHSDRAWGKAWYGDWVCGNAAGTNVYVSPHLDNSLVSAKLDTNPSWFVCYVRGDWHAGGNNVWYRTQGDRIVGYPGAYAWGFVPAVNVWTSTDPWPGMPVCKE